MGSPATPSVNVVRPPLSRSVSRSSDAWIGRNAQAPTEVDASHCPDRATGDLPGGDIRNCEATPIRPR